MVQIKSTSAQVIISFMNVKLCYFMVCQLLTFRYSDMQMSMTN